VTGEDLQRPDVQAAIRGGDGQQPMEAEPEIATASLHQARFWRATYAEILAMEELVLAKVHDLMAKQSAASRREVELSNVPVIAAQVDRFRVRFGYWDARVQALEDGAGSASE
jgi:hypothetical protein